MERAINSTKVTKSAGPDNICALHLKHLGPTAIAVLTHIFNLSLNQNNIPQIWKTAKIIPIPKPNKDTNHGASFRPISLLSPIAKTLERAILPILLPHIPNLPTQHGFKPGYSTTTALHCINETITSGLNCKPPPKRTIMVTLDMSKAFDTVNLHLLTDKLLRTTTHPTLKRYISNYIKGRQAYTTYNNQTSSLRLIKTGVPQGGVLSPILFNLYLSDLPNPPEGVSVTSYADDITPLSTHVSIETAQTQLQPYLNQLHDWTTSNHLTINPDKSSATLFTTDNSQLNTELKLTMNNIPIPTTQTPKVLGVTFDRSLTFRHHIDNAKEKANKSLNLLKALSGTSWGKQKETLLSTYKAVVRPHLEYASTVWSPNAAPTNINKLQIVQNAALRTVTGCTKDTPIQHLNDETSSLPFSNHLQLHSSLLRQRSHLDSHPLFPYTDPHRYDNKRYLRPTIFHNKDYTYNIPLDTNLPISDTIKSNCQEIHSTIVQGYLSNRQPNFILGEPPPNIDKSEMSLPRQTRRTLAQLRTGRSSSLLTYLNKINPTKYPSSLCPACNIHPHDTHHLFTCTTFPTQLTPKDLWSRPVEVAALLASWSSVLPQP